MNKLIKYFNENYGKDYGKVSYPRTTLQIYQVYQIIKDCDIEDNELQTFLQEIKLPKPKTIEEREMYSECFGEIGISDEMLPCYIKEISILKISKEKLKNGKTFKDDNIKNIIINGHLDLEDKTYKIKYKNNVYDLSLSGKSGISKIFIYQISSENFIGVMTNATLDEGNEPVESENSYIFAFGGEFNTELSDIEIFDTQIKKIDPIFLPSMNEIDKYLIVGTKVGNIGEYSTAFGENVEASGNWSHAEGVDTRATGLNSHAEGNNTVASGGNSHAEGSDTIASGARAHVEGQNCKAVGWSSHAEGGGTTANGESSHAEGSETTASGSYSHAEGESTTASGRSSHAEGGSENNALKIIPNLQYNTTETIIKSAWDSNKFSLAKGVYSHVEGFNSLALGECSHVEGRNTMASALNSHAEGESTTASGRSSHAEGLGTVASGNYSHAEGWNTAAYSDYQHIQGKYNIEDYNEKYAHIVGNGINDDKRSNAHTLDWNGNAWFAGKLSQEGTPTDSKDLITKKYFDSNIPKSSDLTDYAKKTDLPKKASDVGADATGTAASKVNEHNTSASSHSDIRSLITNLTTKLNTLADSDDTTLDQLSEIVAYIKNNKSLIDGITTSKLNISDVADNLTTNITNKVLSAKQGVELKKLIDAITVPTKVSQLTNDSKFLTSVPAEYITEDELNTKGYLTKHQDISGKVDKVEGKGLSTVDFTTTYETKLKGLSNYNDTIIKNDIDAINTKINTMFKFNDNGELVVTIGGVSKTFVPKSE